MFLRNQVIVQRQGIELIGSERRIVPVWTIDHIVEVVAVGIPKSLPERFNGLGTILPAARSICRLTEPRGERFTNGQRSNPATVAVTVTSPETITVKNAQCQRQGTQWQVDGSTTVLTGSMTIYNVSPVPAAPTPAQVLVTVPIAAGKWSFKASGGPACVSPLSLKSTGGGTRNGVAVTIR